MRRLLPILLLLLLVACGAAAPVAELPASAVSATAVPTAIPCAAQEYASATRPIYTAWTDAAQLAGSTQRINLPAQIDKLQGLRRDFQNVSVPECMKATHALLLQGMDDTIHAYLDFLAQRDKDRVTALLQLAKQYESAFQAQQSGQSASALPLYIPVPADALSAAYNKAGYHMQQRQLGDGRIAFDGKSGDISVEVVSNQGNAEQVYLSTDKATRDQLIAAGRWLFLSGLMRIGAR